MKVVIDTNVLVAALKSRRGASYKLVSLIPSDKFSIVISVPLILEYEAVLLRGELPAAITDQNINDFIDFLCSAAIHQKVFFLWRPFLPDPADDLVLEVAVAARCNSIITFNKRDFRGINKFGLRVLSPKDLLIEIGAIP